MITIKYRIDIELLIDSLKILRSTRRYSLQLSDECFERTEDVEMLGSIAVGAVAHTDSMNL